jgi:hypothetical protein
VKRSKCINNQLSIYSHYVNKLISHQAYTLDKVSKNKVTSLENILFAPYSIYYEDNNIGKIPEIIPENISNIPFWGNRSRLSVENQLNRNNIDLDKSVVYELENVLITENSLFCKQYRQALTMTDPKTKDFLLPIEYQELTFGVFAHNPFSRLFWGHWLMSELPMQFRMQNDGPFISNDKRNPFRDEPIWRDRLDLPEIKSAKVWRVDKLLVSNPCAMDPSTIKNWFAIREKIKNNDISKKLIYIKRGQTGQQRVLTNEDDLIVKLEKIGFEIIEINDVIGNELIELLLEADVVIGVEGSHMDPILYTFQDGGLLIVLQPPGRVSLNTVTNSAICGIASSIYVCDFDKDYFNFKIKLDDFFGFYERANKWTVINADERINRARNFENELKKV